MEKSEFLPYTKLMEPLTLPFGKHKGVRVNAAPHQYLRWLIQQPDTRRRYADLAAEIERTLKASPAGADDSPAHNALQARFLDMGFAKRAAVSFLRSTAGTGRVRIEKVEFEEVSDVAIEMRVTSGMDRETSVLTKLYIEVKPTIGDDFPHVLRQTKSQRQHAPRHGKISFAVVYDQLATSTVDAGAVEQMFKCSDIALLSVGEILAVAPDLRLV